MATRIRICRFILLLGLLGVLCSFATSEAQASHLRFGHLTWEPRPEISPTTVDFRLTLGARRSFFRGSASDGRPQIGDIISLGSLQFGDGRATSVQLRIVASNPQEDWVIGVASERTDIENEFIRKTYPSPTRANGQPWIASVQINARIGSLRTSGSMFRIQAQLDLTDQLRSPASNLAPIITCGRGEECRFAVPAVDPDGNGLRWRLATSGESRITRYAGPPHSDAPLTIDAETGIVSWPTEPESTLGFYATAIQIEDLDEDGNVRNSVPIDFLVRLEDFADNDPPVFDVPPSPEPGETLTIPAGAPLTVTIQASDPDADDSVILNHVGLPDGAEFVTAGGNPTNGTFSWTPVDGQQGEYLVTFTAIDGRGRAASPHPLRIKVVDPGIRDVSVITEINDDNISVLPDSFAREPANVEQGDGVTRIEWYFPSLTPEDTETLDLAVDLQAPSAGEQRLLTRSVSLAYTDINGNRIRQELDPQYVEVLPSIFEVNVATERSIYDAKETVDIASNLSNLSRFTADANLHLEVIDADGVLVADLGVHTVAELESGETRLFDEFAFSTGTTYIGSYQVHASVLDDAQDVLAEAVAPFEIKVDESVAISGRVTTDRTSYDVGDSVQVEDRISNTVSNLLAEDLLVETTLRTPDGEVFWQEQSSLQQLPPESFRDLSFRVPLGRAPAGLYSVELEIFRDDGRLAASDATEVEVRSTAESGAGVAGLLAAFPRPVLRTENLNLLAEVLNSGNTDVQNLPLTLSVVNPLDGVIIAEWSRQLDELRLDAPYTFKQSWDVLVPTAGRRYVAVLSTMIGDQEQTLAVAPLAVEEKLRTAIIPEFRGRILALVDGPSSLLEDGNSCDNPGELEFAVPSPLALQPGDQVTAEFYDQNGGLLESDQGIVGDFASEWLERGREGLPLALSRLDRGSIQVALMELDDAGEVRLAVTVDGSSGVQTFESGYLVPDCRILETDNHGDFTLVAAWAQDEMDPHGPADAPRLAEQRRYLESVLRDRGWSYTLVTSVDTFRQAFESDHYTAFALFQEQIKLSERLQRDLVSAVEDGAGLLVGGRHDQRSGRLDAALGLKFRGRLPHVEGMTVTGDDVFPAGDVAFRSSIKPLRASLAGATALAGYEPEPRQGLATAIAHNRHGAGNGVYFGYDLLVEGALDDEDFHADLLVAGLETLVAGTAEQDIPLGIAVRVSNLGDGSTGELLLPATDGVLVLDAGPARITADGGVHWRFHVDQGTNVTLPLWLHREPHSPDEIQAHLRISTASGEMVDYGRITIRFP